MQSVQQNYIISYLVGRLQEGKNVLRTTGDKWAQGEMDAEFFEYLNFTQPCKEECPVKYGIFHSCSLSSNLKKIHLKYSLPLVSANLTIVEADPFMLMKRKNNQICTMLYKGPKTAIISKEEDCVYAIHTERSPVGKIPLSPSLECKPELSFSENEEYFKEHACGQMTEKDFVQVKVYNNMYYIYCAGSTYIMGKRNVTCPDKIFMLPLTATFKIGNVEYKGSVLNIVYKQTEDPLFVEKVQWHLNPHVKWENLSQTFDEEWKKNEARIHSDNFYYHSGTNIIMWLVIAMIMSCVSTLAVVALFKWRGKICSKKKNEETQASRQAEGNNHRVIVNTG